MHAHRINFLCFFVFFLIFFLFLAFYFLSILFRALPLSFFNPLFWARSRSSYSACRDHILLFCPFTTFVWSRYTCRLPLVRLHPPSPALDKGKLFYLLVCRGTLSCHGVGAFSLYPSWHVPNGSSLNLTSFGWSVIPAGRTSQNSLSRSREIGIFPSPHHQTIPPYL